MKVKNDHRSKFSNLSYWKEEAWKKSGLQRISREPRERIDSRVWKTEIGSLLWSFWLGKLPNDEKATPKERWAYLTCFVLGKKCYERGKERKKIAKIKPSLLMVNNYAWLITLLFSFSWMLSGYYMYIETSFPRKPNDKAWLISPKYTPAPNGKCFNFWYHMSGRHIGSLNVYLKDSIRLGKMVWNETGNQGSSWLHAKAPIKTNLPFQVWLKRVLV